ncbi:hypothetical protein QVD99_007732 [Batrachochytrium dendrobatidis]|uniref:Velvet domain-containing protein n=1 Tax=Batrachochytrium dendrobatidis (strain JEL423) TaxID=403673 RepID=A0A177WYU8_BATDL|nr:hypothetical protein QVD99_007732 [Batrachochytrium dendrobatidis]OAJ44815.1 hypothetical protein BDEG_28007 [Batrachochytrium dendrobatidis JEL423]
MSLLNSSVDSGIALPANPSEPVLCKDSNHHTSEPEFKSTKELAYDDSFSSSISATTGGAILWNSGADPALNSVSNRKRLRSDLENNTNHAGSAAPNITEFGRLAHGSLFLASNTTSSVTAIDTTTVEQEQEAQQVEPRLDSIANKNLATSHTSSTSPVKTAEHKSLEPTAVASFNGLPKLVVRQEPIHGRTCGFANVKDRRMINPALILQVVNQNGDVQGINSDDYLCLVSLAAVEADGGGDRSAALNSRSKMCLRARNTRPEDANDITRADLINQTVVGANIKTADLLIDLNGTNGVFFIFSDISVRVHGRYRLKCQLMKKNFSNGEFNLDVCSIAYTRPFMMYPPKNYPGMTEGTNLSRWFSQQGALVSVRRFYVSEDAMNF